MATIQPDVAHATRTLKGVLNAGSGSSSARGLHRFFKAEEWAEVTIDIDPEAAPDIVGTLTDMAAIPAQSFDAVWSSHSLEHLAAYEVPAALSEFRRILKSDGFVLITCPDIETIVAVIAEKGLNHVAYLSPAGPITTHDMLFGHSPSIARGNGHMTHRTGFTCASLGRLLVNAGFPVVLAQRSAFDLWVLALMEKADQATLQWQLKAAGLDFYSEDAPADLATSRKDA